ncbi:MAG TPA: sulfotransferase [Streptosporangiaceae bacterium]|nr:sulfotransferase [Streptosporangiaceae bacterium]
MPTTSDISDKAPEACRSPVFILTASRSGSTLLRFILDSHPDLACPPETSIASVCAGLARTWDILESAGSGSGRPVHEALPLPPHAAVAVREAIDRVYGRYLQRRGKKRWCDKSLDSFQFAELITQVYPEAKFICLYRHCMDVIASGVEVCPWGLHRFGFDPHVAQYPGNSVAAIGSYWLSVCQAVLGFEEKFPQLCHRVRYEDLVTRPEETATAVFDFLGLSQVPGIAQSCFETPHEGEGPGDEKIWFTNRVTSGSMGRGVTVPVGALMPPIRQAMNETLDKLGYRQVDDQWNATLDRFDPRADSAPMPQTAGAGHQDELTSAVTAISDRVAAHGDAGLREASRRWPTVAGSTVALVVQSPRGYHEELRLTFHSSVLPPAPHVPNGDNSDLGAGGTFTGGVPVNGTNGEAETRAGDSDEPVAQIIAAPATWLSLLEGGANFVTELTSGRLRCVNKRDGHRIRSDEVHAVATLLGMTRIPMARNPLAEEEASDVSVRTEPAIATP